MEVFQYSAVGKTRRNQGGENDEGGAKEARGKPGETLKSVSRSNGG